MIILGKQNLVVVSFISTQRRSWETRISSEHDSIFLFHQRVQAMPDHLANDAPIGPDVRLLVVVLRPKDVFRSSVISGTHVNRQLSWLLLGGFRSHRLLSDWEGSRPAQIAKLNMARFIDKDVLGSQISVHDSRRVKEVDGDKQVVSQHSNLFPRKIRLGLEQLLKVGHLELHDQVQGFEHRWIIVSLFVGKNFEELCDIAVVVHHGDLSEDEEFARNHDAVSVHHVLVILLQSNYLDSNLLFGLGVDSLVDAAVGALADLFQDMVVVGEVWEENLIH